MGPKKKSNKKTSKSSSKSDKKSVADDEFSESIIVDDDGTISSTDIREVSTCIFSTGKQLHKVATKFIEVFKNRSSYSLGSCLLTYHEYLTNIDTEREKVSPILLHRIVIIYLIYRIRDIEPCIKRRPEKKGDSMVGHPFTEFFLSLAPSTVPFQIPQPAIAETQLALLLMARRGNEIGNMTSSELVEMLLRQKPLPLEAPKDLCDHFDLAFGHWPSSLETRCDQAIMENPLPGRNMQGVTVDPHRPITVETLASVGEQLLVQQNVTTLPMLNSTLSYEIPRDYPITAHEVLHDSFVPQSDTDIDSRYTYDLMRFAYSGEMKGMYPQFHLIKDLSDMGQARIIDDHSRPSTSKDAAVQPGPTPADTLRAQMNDFVDKLMNGAVLNPSELRIALKYVESASAHDPLVGKMFEIPLTVLPQFLEENTKLAQLVIFEDVALDHQRLNRYVNVMLGMDIIVQNIELLNQLYTAYPSLDRDPLHEYLRYCIRFCQQDELSASQQTRVVRMVCIFIGTLVKRELLVEREIINLVEKFVLEFSKHKESMTLYQALVANMREEIDAEEASRGGRPRP